MGQGTDAPSRQWGEEDLGIKSVKAEIPLGLTAGTVPNGEARLSLGRIRRAAVLKKHCPIVGLSSRLENIRAPRKGKAPNKRTRAGFRRRTKGKVGIICELRAPLE